MSEQIEDTAIRLLGEVMGLIDEGQLVRDTSHDHNSDWAIKMLPLAKTLSEAANFLSVIKEMKDSK